VSSGAGGRAHAGIVDDDVDAAEGLGRGGKQGVHARAIGDVGPHGDAVGAELSRQGGSLGFIQVSDGHLGALGDKAADDALAEPGRPACDDGAFIGQTHAVSP